MAYYILLREMASSFRLRELLTADCIAIHLLKSGRFLSFHDRRVAKVQPPIQNIAS